MTDYYQVRREAHRRGKLAEGSAPIPILPTKEFTLTRLVNVPVFENGKKAYGQYMQQPAVITVVAFTAGEASARADEIVYNTSVQLWGQGSTPWGESKGSWRKVELPGDVKPLDLR